MLGFLPQLQDIFREVLTGILGGSIVAGGAFLRNVYLRRKVEAKYPIAGDYISFYEDIADGEQIVVKSASRISQKGRAVTLTTTNNKDTRSWTLEGTISPGGHVSGVYSADDVYDDGVGSFYLKISKNNLDGMWNGYDNENKKTSGGRYWFKKLYDIQVSPFKTEHLNDILHTSVNAFGYGYLDADSIMNDEVRYAIVATVDDEFAGFCLGYVEREKNLAEITQQSHRIVPDDVRMADDRGSLGVIKSIVVRKKFRGHGVGTSLIKMAEEELIRRSADCILVPAWKMDDGTNIQDILLSLDYSEWFESKNYWRADCDAGKFECVARANDLCRCSVVFYRKGRI